MSVTAYFRLSTPRAKVILREVEHAIAGWRAAGRNIGMPDHDLESFANTFEHSERTATQRRLSTQNAGSSLSP